MKFQKGHKVNTGRKQTEEHKRNRGAAVSAAKKGKPAWSKGKTGIYSKETLEKMSNAQKENTKGEKNGMYGKKQTEESRELIRKKALGRKRSVASIKKQRASMVLRMSNKANRKFKDTGIELKIEEELKKRNINYLKQVPLCKVALVDFYLPDSTVVIQCDGNFWHNYPHGKPRDAKQDFVLKNNGFNVYRFWEHEINMSPSDCLDKIILKIC